MSKRIILADPEVNADLKTLNYKEFLSKYPWLSSSYYYSRRDSVLKGTNEQFLYPDWIRDPRYDLVRFNNKLYCRFELEDEVGEQHIEGFHLQYPDHYTLVGGVPNGRWYSMDIKRSQRK